MDKRWYKRQRYIILLLIFFFPIGLWLMWKYTAWSKRPKIAITIFIGLFIIFAVVSYDPEQPMNVPVSAPQTATVAPKAQSVPDPQQQVNSLIDQAETTCRQYAQHYFLVKNINVSHGPATDEKQQPDGTILVKADIADSQGLLEQEKPLGTMECTTNSNGITVLSFATY